MKLYKEHKLNKDNIKKIDLEIKNDIDTFENDNENN